MLAVRNGADSLQRTLEAITAQTVTPERVVAVDARSTDASRSRLQEAGVAIEGRTAWPRGGESLYLRDPDGHLLELATPGLWAIY